MFLRDPLVLKSLDWDLALKQVHRPIKDTHKQDTQRHIKTPRQDSKPSNR